MSGSPSADRLESLAASISQYLAQTNFDVGEQGEIDRVERRFSSAPENFITPNPGVPFQEDLSQNWEAMKDQFGLTPQGDLETQLEDYDDRLRDFLVGSVRNAIDDEGALAVAQYVYEGVPIGDSDVEETIDDILEEASPDVFRAEIEDSILQIESNVPGGFDLGVSTDEQTLVEELESITGATYADLDRAVADIEDRLRDADADAERRLLSRFEQAFGQRFDDVDDAIDSLRSQFDALQDLDIDTVEASFLGGGTVPNVSLPAGFGEFEDTVADRAAGVIDLEATADALPSRNRPVAFADVRIREGQIEQIDYGKAIETPSIIVREDATFGPETAPQDDRPEEIEEVASADPTPDEDDTDDPTTPGLPDTFEGINEDATRTITDTLEATADDEPQLLALAETLSSDELFRVAAAAGRGRLPADVIDTLRDVFLTVDAATRRRAGRLNDGVGQLQTELNLDPGDFEEDPDVEFFERDVTDDTGDGPTQDDVVRSRGESPERSLSREDVRDEIRDMAAGGADAAGEDIKAQQGSDRPDPFQSRADERLQRLFGGRSVPAQQWVAAEQRRLEPAQRGETPLSPAEFWDEFGSKVWNTLTREQFVGLTV